MTDVMAFVQILMILVPVLLVVVAALWIVREDVVAFEISFGACAVLVLSGLGLALAHAGPGSDPVFDGLVAAAIAGLVAWIVHRFAPARLSRGDIVLLASMGAVTGTELMPLLMGLFSVFCVATAAFYSVRRGKRLFRSAFPAALPAMAALLPVLAWRHGAMVLALFAGSVGTPAATSGGFPAAIGAPAVTSGGFPAASGAPAAVTMLTSPIPFRTVAHGIVSGTGYPALPAGFAPAGRPAETWRKP